MEQIYVSAVHRRTDLAQLLFEQAELLVQELGGERVFNTVHPNNDDMIAFLARQGYTVLNLIGIRKPYQGEPATSKMQVGEQWFDY